ncbi:MAG: ABC transporter ATP-binding protein [bacterium]
MAAILQAKDLTKHYPAVKAVDGVSLSIEEGICFGLLGPNGAGKTTTVEMMEGLIVPTSGEILYRGAGRDKSFKLEVGIQFQSTVLQDFLTTKEVLELFGSFYPTRVPLDDLVQMCSLGEFLNQDNRKLSGGQRQRLFLALALVNDPKLLFLDEPTTGLDPQARQNFWSLIQTIKKQAKTVVLTTHYMEEAHVLCDEIAIMDHGRILIQGAPEALLRENFKGARLEIPSAVFAPDADFPWPYVERGEQLDIETPEVNETIRYLMEREVPLAEMRVKSPTLEDLFLDLTGTDLRG